MSIQITPIPTLTEFGTPDLTLTTANAAGTAGVKTTIRTDASVLAYDATLPDAIAYGQSGSVGSAATAARRDHSHAMAASTAVAAATVAEMVAASSTTVYATPGRTQNHPGVAKVVVKIETDGSLVAGSYGVTSVDDDGTGDRTINFSTDFANINYIATNAQFSNNTAAIGYMFLTNVEGSVQLLVRNLDTDTLADFGSTSTFYGLQ